MKARSALLRRASIMSPTRSKRRSIGAYLILEGLTIQSTNPNRHPGSGRLGLERNAESRHRIRTSVDLNTVLFSRRRLD